MAERFKAAVLKTAKGKPFEGSNPSPSEFVEKTRADVDPLDSHPHTLPSRIFLDRLLRLGSAESLFFPADGKPAQKRLENKLRVRLWRYAERGEIRYREFNVLAVAGGRAVVRNLDPTEQGRKRNLRARPQDS